MIPILLRGLSGRIKRSPRARSTNEVIGSILALPITIVELAVHQVGILVRDLLVKYTPLPKIVARYDHLDDCIDHLAAEARAMPQTAGDLLVHGKRREHAESILPPHKHPTWYTDVPKHLRRSIVAHGRLRETALPPAPLIAGNAVHPAFVRQCWAKAVDDGVDKGVSSFLLALLIAALVAIAVPAATGSIQLLQSGDQPQHLLSGLAGKADQREPTTTVPRAAEPSMVANSYRDVWSDDDLRVVNEQLHAVATAASSRLSEKWASGVAAVVALPLQLAMILLGAAIYGFASGRLTFIGRLIWLVTKGADESVKHVRKPFREALQRWRFFGNDRKVNDKGHNDQVHFATQVDRSPLVYFGDGEGMAEFAGHIQGPREGHQLKQSVVDMLQHTMVLGGSGESKSRDFYIPVLSQLLELRKAGYPIATYITDDKGAIVEDVRRMVAKLGLEQDLLVIGTGPDEWRVDLMDLGRPYLVAEFIKSAGRQAGAGDSGEDFWPEMGNDLALNIWTLTEAAQHTEQARDWERENGIRYHSIKNMLRLAISDEALEQTIGWVAAAMRSDDDYRRIAHLDDDALHGAIEYLLDQWLPMAVVTRDGIKANLRKALRTFTFKPDISRGFADGAGDKLLSARELHSNRIKVLNVSQIEHGSAGRLVNIMLKSGFFKQCRDVQQLDPAFVDQRLAWWFNPDLANPAKDDYYLEFFLADEYQSLITADASSGYSDLTVWNVLRSAGVAGVTISQGLGAYEAAVGKEAAANILRQWRSKHFLRTEDTATIEEAKKLLGKTMRFHVSDWAHYESTAAVRAELGTDPDNLQPAVLTDELASFDGRHGLSFDSPDFGSWDEAHGYDGEFVLQQSAGYTASANYINLATAVGTEQQAAWRYEDRNTQALQQGVVDADVLRDEQVMNMTRGRSLSLIQVAGGTQVDIIRLNASAYRRYSDDDTGLDATAEAE